MAGEGASSEARRLPSIKSCHEPGAPARELMRMLVSFAAHHAFAPDCGHSAVHTGASATEETLTFY